jgi:hypothetical protein
MEQALKGVKATSWYTPPPNVVRGSGNSWYLDGVTSIQHLPGDTLPATPAPDAGGQGDANGNNGNGNGPLPIIGGVPIGRRPSPVPPGGGIIPPGGG